MVDETFATIQEEAEAMYDDVKSTVRNGVVSADTKLITKALLFIGLQLQAIANCANDIADDVNGISNEVENCAIQLKEIDSSINQLS